MAQEILNDSRQTFCGFTTDLDQARVMVFGAPFDSTASFRPGSRFAPNAMRYDSWGMESYSPYQDLDLEEDVRVYDLGDLDLPFGQTGQALTMIENQTRAIVDRSCVPVMLGGEHSLTLAPVRVLAGYYPDLELVHFDAHTDLREDYMGEKLSHASVIKRCWEVLGDGKIHSLGIRSGLKEEFVFAHNHLDFQAFKLDGAPALAAGLAKRATPIYLTLDLDVLDPSVFPGTGTPEPGGCSFNDLLSALLAFRGCNIVGFDLVELAPHYDQSGVSTAVACKLLREMLLLLASPAG